MPHQAELSVPRVAGAQSFRQLQQLLMLCLRLIADPHCLPRSGQMRDDQMILPGQAVIQPGKGIQRRRAVQKQQGGSLGRSIFIIDKNGTSPS